MRSYDIAVASLAIGAPIRWTDNAISQHLIPGVTGRQRGVTRRIAHSALVTLAVVRQLHILLGLSVRDAVSMAIALLDSSGPGVPGSGQLRVTLDRPALEQAIEHRLRDALESAPARPRGRPPGRTRGGRVG